MLVVGALAVLSTVGGGSLAAAAAADSGAHTTAPLESTHYDLPLVLLYNVNHLPHDATISGKGDGSCMTAPHFSITPVHAHIYESSHAYLATKMEVDTSLKCLPVPALAAYHLRVTLHGKVLGTVALTINQVTGRTFVTTCTDTGAVRTRCFGATPIHTFIRVYFDAA
jgi:hypothetical protein